MNETSAWHDLFHDGRAHKAIADWKAASCDVLGAMRERWVSRYPALADAKLDALRDNYATESPETFLPALGHELGTLALRLYTLPSDGDDYWLVVLAEDEASAFEQAARDHNCELRWERQPRRKFGEPAKRLKLGTRLPYLEASLEHRALAQAGRSHALLKRWQLVGTASNAQTPRTAWIDLQTWPPQVPPQDRFLPAAAVVRHEQSGTCAALFDGRPDGETTLRLATSREADAAQWELVQPPQPLDLLSKLAFFDNDLLVAREADVWIVPDAAQGSRECRHLLQVPSHPDFAYPGVALSGDGRNWLVLAGQVHAWEAGRLHATPFSVRRHIDFRAMPTTHGFAYVDADGVLVELDVDTGRQRQRALTHLDHKATVRALGETGWAVLLRWGSAQRGLDLVQFWHPQQDRWLRMPYGALGTHAVKDVLLTPDGELWTSDHAHTVCSLGSFVALLEQLVLPRSGSLSRWSEWSPSQADSPEPRVAEPTPNPLAAADPPASADVPATGKASAWVRSLGTLFGRR